MEGRVSFIRFSISIITRFALAGIYLLTFKRNQEGRFFFHKQLEQIKNTAKDPDDGSDDDPPPPPPPGVTS